MIIWTRSFLIVLVLSSIACEPPCIKGHYDVRHIPEQCSFVPLTIGDVTIYMYQCEPAHDIQVWVCDQYQAEK